MKLFKKKWVRVIALSLAGLVLCGIFLLIVLPGALFKVPYSTILYSAEGELLSARIAGDGQWRFPMAKGVPPKYEKALLAFEDRRFYYHLGVDPISIARAVSENIKAGKIVSGGSTITMQVIRLSLNQSRTLFNKVKEAFLSIALEIKYSKKEILSLYASHASFGGNVIGIEAAAWRFFGRDSKNLTWAESALLAVLPNNPSFMHPGKNREALLKKRNSLLKKLKKLEEINDMEYHLALAEPLPSNPYPLPNLAAHLIDSLGQIGIQNKSNPIYHTALRSEVQKKLLNLIQQYYGLYSAKGIHNISCIVIDNENTEVVAYVGNTQKPEEKNNSALGQDIDIIQRPRSTGSILKPILYLAMLQDGEILPETLVSDVPSQFDGYMPQNYDRQYRGAVPAKEVIARSLNVPAVKMLHEYGLYKFYSFLKEIGISTLFRMADNYGLTLILGGAEGTLWDIARIYSNIAQAAQFNKIWQIRILKNQEKKIKKSWVSSGPAYLTLEAMMEAARPGMEGYWKTFQSSQKIYWKTGTSYGFKDAWTIGVTPKYTVGVWVGNADGEAKPELTGITSAAPILFDVFNFLEKSAGFKPPLLDLKEVAVCKESGYLAVSGCKQIMVLAPKSSHFSKVSPYHFTVHLDKKKRFQVHSGCESTDNMEHISFFVLPPVQEYYYKRISGDYQSLPPYRQDCLKNLHEMPGKMIYLIYPNKETRLYIPIALDGKPTQVMFKAVHRNPEITLYWHLDNVYLGATKKFHEMFLQPAAGIHNLVLVDENGYSLQRNFEVLAKPQIEAKK